MAWDERYYAFWEGLVAASRLRFHESVRDSLSTGEVVRAKCMEYTKAMTAAFPELRRVSGFYTFGEEDGSDTEESPGEEHWWCVAPDGSIIDPTAAQFFPGGNYVEYREDFHVIRRGRCMACGSDIYGLKALGHASICPDSTECHDIMVRETS